jgi:hypothetical protein
VKDTKTPETPSPEPRSPKNLVGPPASAAYRFVRRTWWMPWAIGAAVVTVGTLTAIEIFAGGDKQAGWNDVHLPHSTHHVVYEITGAGKSPEIRYVVDGINGSETVTNAGLPWHRELTIEVGPGLGVVQVAAENNELAGPLSCSVRVDGNIVHQATAPAGGSSVSCSSVIRP